MYATMAGTLMGMGHIATKETYEWLRSRPKVNQSLSINGRPMNDMAGFEVQKNVSFCKFNYEVRWVKFKIHVKEIEKNIVCVIFMKIFCLLIKTSV